MLKNREIFAKIRNSPLFFLPLLLLVGYALASLAYVLIMENEGSVNQVRQQVVDAAPYSGLTSDNTRPHQVTASSNGALTNWKSDNAYQVISAFNVASSKIYLFNSKNTRDYFTSSGKSYDPILDQWHYYFRDRGVKYIDLQEVDLTPDLKPGILILPSAVALSSEGRSAILAFVIGGGSVLAT